MKPKVLYIDDEEINIDLFEINFEEYFDIVTSQSGKNGLDLLITTSFDVVISDMKMPEMNGLEFIEKARNINHNALYYILTGFNLMEDIQTAINDKKITGYFSKPMEVNEIVNKINQHLTRLQEV